MPDILWFPIAVVLALIFIGAFLFVIHLLDQK